MRDQILFIQNTLFVEVITILQKNDLKRIRKDKGKDRVDSDSDKQRTERTPRKCFRCRSVDRIITKCPNPTKDNKK